MKSDTNKQVVPFELAERIVSVLILGFVCDGGLFFFTIIRNSQLLWPMIIKMGKLMWTFFFILTTLTTLWTIWCDPLNCNNGLEGRGNKLKTQHLTHLLCHHDICFVFSLTAKCSRCLMANHQLLLVRAEHILYCGSIGAFFSYWKQLLLETKFMISEFAGNPKQEVKEGRKTVDLQSWW